MRPFSHAGVLFNGTFLTKLFKELEPLIVQLLSDLLLKALLASSNMSGTAGGSGGAQSATGSPLTPAERNLMSLLARFQEYALSPEGAAALTPVPSQPGNAPRGLDA
jgi:hypothetical protein